MAFQVGTQVDPRLLDYSGYAQGLTNAATIEASALANLGKEVGASVEKYQKKKLEKEQKAEIKTSMLSSLEQMFPDKEQGELNAIADGIIKGSPSIESLSNLNSLMLIQGMKGQQARDVARLKAFGELAEKETLSIADQQKVAEGFGTGGAYTEQGFVIEGGQLFQIIPTKGDFNPFTKDEERVPITSGPVYESARKAGLLMQTPEIDTSKVGQPPVGTGTVLKESNATGSSTAIPNDLNLDIPLEEAPTSEQFTDITSQVDYGEFDVPKPVIKKQEGYRDLTPLDRPKTYKEFKESKRKRSDATPEKYQKYLDNFEYKYPMTFEEYSSPNTGLINYETGKGLYLDFSDRGRFGGSEERYINEYLPRFY